jgi:hypothetical protein
MAHVGWVGGWVVTTVLWLRKKRSVCKEVCAVSTARCNIWHHKRWLSVDSELQRSPAPALQD